MMSIKNTLMSIMTFLLFVIFSISTVSANTITVTTADDTTAIDFLCSLREAIFNANTDPAVVFIGECNAGSGNDVIEFDPSLDGTPIVLSIVGTEEDSSTDGDLDITENLTINGNGVGNTIIDGNGDITGERVFHIDPMNLGITVDINDLTITGGDDSSGFGGGSILTNVSSGSTLDLSGVVIDGNSSTQSGGAINNGSSNTVNIVDSIISNNTAGNGVVRNNSSSIMNISNSTIFNNFATANNSGIQNSGGTLTVQNVTISGNSAVNFGGGLATAGGAGVATLNNVTIANNTAGVSGGGIDIGSGNLTISNSIVTNNGDDCFIGGTLTSTGNNIDSDGSCSFTDPTDLPNVDPLLAPLADNGGPTLTHALFEGSPAIDMGSNINCEPADQRGQLRPVDGDDDTVADCDIGAVEMLLAEIIAEPSSGGSVGGCSLAPSHSGNSFSDLSLLMLFPALILIRKLIRKNILKGGI